MGAGGAGRPHPTQPRLGENLLVPTWPPQLREELEFARLVPARLPKLPSSEGHLGTAQAQQAVLQQAPELEWVVRRQVLRRVVQEAPGWGLQDTGGNGSGETRGSGATLPLQGSANLQGDFLQPAGGRGQGQRAQHMRDSTASPGEGAGLQPGMNISQ